MKKSGEFFGVKHEGASRLGKIGSKPSDIVSEQFSASHIVPSLLNKIQGQKP
jgi:hypothetical protein